MPEQLTSTFNTAAVVRYVLRNHPEQSNLLLHGLDRVLGTDPDQTEAALMAKGGWVPLEAFGILLKRAQKDIFNEPLTPFRIGFEVMLYQNWDPVSRLMFRALAHPKLLLHLGGRMIRRYSQQIAEFTPSNFSANSCDVKLSWVPSEYLSENNCLYLQGIIAGIPLNWGKPPAEVRETACQFNGDGACRIRISWNDMGLKQWLQAALLGPSAKNSRALLDTVQDNTMNLARLNSNLIAARSSYQAVVESAPDAICELWPDDSIIPLNSRCQEIMTAGRQGKMTLRSLVHPDDLPELLEKLKQKSVSHGEVLIHRFRIVGRDRSVSKVEASFTKILKPERKSVILGILRDVGSHEELSRALAEQRLRFEILAEHSPLGLAFIDEAGNYLYTNPRFESMFGYNHQNLENGAQWFRQAFPDPKIRDEVIGCWKTDKETASGPEDRIRIFTVTCKDGLEKDILFRPVTLPGGQQLITYEDVTERNRLENERQESARLAGVVELAGAAAHELNQPLTALLTSAELMRNYDDLDQLKRLAATVGKQAERLGGLVGQLGRVVRYETKEYLGGNRIIDLEKASRGHDEPETPISPKTGDTHN